MATPTPGYSVELEEILMPTANLGVDTFTIVVTTEAPSAEIGVNSTPQQYPAAGREVTR